MSKLKTVILKAMPGEADTSAQCVALFLDIRRLLSRS